MIIAVTGTPGTGKTTVAERLADALDHEYVAVNAVAQEAAVETVPDPARGATAVDTDSLVAHLQDRLGKDAVLDGHLAHHYPADVTVVLRCHPDELRDRLQEKGWDDDKIAENVDAERLDLILQQAVAQRETVYEVDTTDRSAEDVVDTVRTLVVDGDGEQHRPGHISWPLDSRPGDTGGA